MKIKHNTHKKYFWIITTSIVVLIAGSVLAYIVFAQNNPFTPPNATNNHDTSDNQQTGDIKNTTNEPNKLTPPNSDHPAQTKTDEATGKRVIPTVASSTVDGNAVYIRGGVNTPETEGVCYAELSGPNNQNIRKDSTLLPSASSTDCKTIIIPTSELSAGEWSFTLNFSSNSAKGKSDVITFVIN